MDKNEIVNIFGIRSCADNLGKALFGIYPSEALKQSICLNCKQPIHFSDEPTNRQGNIYSHLGRKEYLNTGFCEYCFDHMDEE